MHMGLCRPVWASFAAFCITELCIHLLQEAYQSLVSMCKGKRQQKDVLVFTQVAVCHGDSEIENNSAHCSENLTSFQSLLQYIREKSKFIPLVLFLMDEETWQCAEKHLRDIMAQ